MKLAIHIQISQDFVPGKECCGSSSCGPNTPTASVSSAATPPGGRAAVRLPAPETAADAPQQVAGAAARITECREIHHHEVAARGGARKCGPTTLSTKCDGPPR